jgi:hypothetical protein
MQTHGFLSPRLLLACALWLVASPLASQDDGIYWFNNYQDALQEAKRTGKPMFLEYRCEP